GQETVLAQVASEVLDITLDKIRVRHGDTGLILFGGGTYASRSAVMAGNAVHKAAIELRARAMRVAAQLLQTAEAALTLADAAISVRGRPDRYVSMASIARMLSPGNQELLTSPRSVMIEDNHGLTATSIMR